MKVLLVAVNAKYIHSNLAVYSLKEYAEKYGKNEHEIKIKEYTINQYTEEIVADIYEEQADIIGFSCYIWNIQQVMEVINDLKSVCPKKDIWVGGPEVSFNAVQVLSDNVNVDYVMCGEGEEILKQFLDNYHEGKLQRKDINGLVYREDGQIKVNPMMKPVDISDIPFVYRDMKDFENKIIYYETSRGCPFSCSYCLSSIDKKIRFRNLDLVKEELRFFIDNKTSQVKFVDRTFNCNPKHAMEIWRYIKENDNGITNFHFEIAADLMTEEELELISDMRPGLIQLEIGVQSVNEETLQAIHRKTDIGKIESITGRIRQNKNIHQHLDLIAGLPYEDYSSFKNSFNTVYAMKPDQLQLGFLKVLNGAGISEEAKEYGIVCSSRPPYEVLKTKWLTFDEILRLKEIETVVEIYYNSLQFSETIRKLEEFFKSPFDMYERLGRYYKKYSAGGLKHSRVNRYVLLLDFIMEELNLTEEDSFAWKELLTLDFYLRENAKTRPVFAKSLEDSKKKIHKIYCHPQLKQKLKNYVNYSSKQIEHMTHIEVLKGRYILFDYLNRNALTKAASTVDVTTYLQL
ncbi:MAG: B12-binding domain-containing radical SAM protein [Eubacterium sp.]|jgi:radical SAM superfamily enzyme YgiQ (UPF0313 family)|nr:B12-binding domain-containing radical SAM protein [Eubacterium sp.]